MAMLAFLHLPIGRRSPLHWARLLLDGATVAVAGGLIFWYVVLDMAGSTISVATQSATAVVGVGGLVAVVVIGKAAMTPGGPVDSLSLRILTVAPMAGVAAVVLLIAGSGTGRLVLSVLVVPVIGLAMAAAAGRQLQVLGRVAEDRPAPGGRSLFNLLPFLAVAATA